MAAKPFLQTLWLADEVSRDVGTGKVTVRGMFDVIEVKRPATHFTSPAHLFFALRNIHAQAWLRLCYVDLSDSKVLLEREFSVRAGGPLETVDVVILLERIPAPRDGVYSWELFWGNELIGSSCVTARIV